MYKSFEEINSFAAKKKVHFGLENLFPFGKQADNSLLSTPESIFHYLKYSENVNGGFLLDVGHLLIASNYFGFDKNLFVEELLNNFHDRILEIHISGNDGIKDLHSPLHEQDWQIQILKGQLKILEIHFKKIIFSHT